MSGFRLLACFAHPDDEAFPLCGELATRASIGVSVRFVIFPPSDEWQFRPAVTVTL